MCYPKEYIERAIDVHKKSKFGTVIRIEYHTMGSGQQRFVKQAPAFYAGEVDLVDADTVAACSEQLWEIPMVWTDVEG